MKKLIALVLCFYVAGCVSFTSPRSTGTLPQQETIFLRPLQNDCAITATEAFSRLRATGVWTRICVVTLLLPSGPSGHAITVWEPYQGSQTFVYDIFLFNSTMIVSDCGRDENKLVDALNRTPDLVDKHITILSARFVQ